MAHSELGRRRIRRLEYMSEIADELKADGAVFAVKDLAISGSDVISLGCPEGPEVGKILNLLFEKYLAGEISNKRELLMESVKEMIS